MSYPVVRCRESPIPQGAGFWSGVTALPPSINPLRPPPAPGGFATRRRPVTADWTALMAPATATANMEPYD